MSNSIFSRRSIRKFESRLVEKEKLRKLLEAAMCAPTGGNQREWEFVVVTEPELLKRLGAASPYAGSVAEAPLAIVPVANLEACRFEELWQQDLAAATQNILIEAVELGLGAVWLGIAPLPERMEKVAEILKIPGKMLPFAIIPVGYPAELKETGNRYEEAKVHDNRF